MRCLQRLRRTRHRIGFQPTEELLRLNPSGLGTRGFVEFGGEQVADGQAPMRSPAFRQLEHLVVRREMVEAIGALHCPPERQVAGEDTSGRSRATSKAFRKLDVTSRTQLARRLR